MTKPAPMDPKSKDILRALMDPSLPDSVPWSSRDLCAILEHQLSTLLVAEMDQLAATSRLSHERVSAILQKAGCRTYLDVFEHGSPSADVLRLVKNLAKASLAHEEGLPRDVARVLYVLALLRGRQHGVAGLTSLDDASLDREARRCLTFGWLPEAVRRLLRVD